MSHTTSARSQTVHLSYHDVVTSITVPHDATFGDVQRIVTKQWDRLDDFLLTDADAMSFSGMTSVSINEWLPLLPDGVIYIKDQMRANKLPTTAPLTDITTRTQQTLQWNDTTHVTSIPHTINNKAQYKENTAVKESAAIVPVIEPSAEGHLTHSCVVTADCALSSSSSACRVDDSIYILPTELDLPPPNSPIQGELWRIFSFYCAYSKMPSAVAASPTKSTTTSSSPLFESLSLAQWCALLDDSLLLGRPTDGVSRLAAEQTHTHEAIAGKRFTFESFLTSLMKISQTVYHFTAPPMQTFHRLLNEHILPHAKRYNVYESITFIASETVQFLQHHFLSLYELFFQAYASHQQQPPLMTFEQFQTFCIDFKLNKILSVHELSRALHYE